MTNADREQIARLQRQVDSIEQKLDDLIELKNKGAGAFWLASLLFGSALVGSVMEFVQWIKH